MPPSMIRRRIAALAALFAVAFGALWPLVSAAKNGAQIPTFICAQSGGSSHAPSPGGDVNDDFHCPLCVASAAYIAPSIAASRVAPLGFSGATIAAAPAASAHDSHPPRPPPSRAPPALS